MSHRMTLIEDSNKWKLQSGFCWHTYVCA